MAKPIILAVDDDAAVLAAVVRDLRVRYGEEYRVLRAASGREALDLLTDLVLKDRQVAAVVSDQRMPEMSGIEILQEVRQQSPNSKLLLLTAYADTDVAIRGINTSPWTTT
jgi:thioredoxin reductase (NADPH)